MSATTTTTTTNWAIASTDDQLLFGANWNRMLELLRSREIRLREEPAVVRVQKSWSKRRDYDAYRAYGVAIRERTCRALSSLGVHIDDEEQQETLVKQMLRPQRYSQLFHKSGRVESHVHLLLFEDERCVLATSEAALVRTLPPRRGTPASPGTYEFRMQVRVRVFDRFSPVQDVQLERQLAEALARPRGRVTIGDDAVVSSPPTSQPSTSTTTTTTASTAAASAMEDEYEEEVPETETETETRRRGGKACRRTTAAAGVQTRGKRAR